MGGIQQTYKDAESEMTEHIRIIGELVKEAESLKKEEENLQRKFNEQQKEFDENTTDMVDHIRKINEKIEESEKRIKELKRMGDIQQSYEGKRNLEQVANQMVSGYYNDNIDITRG